MHDEERQHQREVDADEGDAGDDAAQFAMPPCWGRLARCSCRACRAWLGLACLAPFTMSALAHLRLLSVDTERRLLRSKMADQARKTGMTWYAVTLGQAASSGTLRGV
jgi:hypothetical protein